MEYHRRDENKLFVFEEGPLLESVYQSKVIKRLYETFDGCFVLKNDSSYMQGIPDLTVLYNTFWAMLEVKAHVDADYQPNQEYYVELLNDMSFAAFIYPEVEDEVFSALQSAFAPRRRARPAKR
jgi:hypothetical protein